MKVSVVTTFSPEGYEVYGRRMIESFKHWPDDVELYAFYEGEKPADASARAIWKPLDADMDRAVFIRIYGGKDDPHDYRFRPVRYSNKVWAYTSMPDDGHLIWLDADTETVREVTTDILKEWLPPDGCTASYLARPYYRHTETGFIGFAPGQKAFLKEIRRLYTSGELLFLPEWHDCAAFDRARKTFERKGFAFYNLCPGANTLEVFEHSPLAGIIEHNKGPRGKATAYGAVL
jgi:hypothetical protein